jgi:hypothetical protein
MWCYNGPPSDADRRVEVFLVKHLKNVEVCHGLSRYWSLYTHLLDHPPTSRDAIRRSVCVDRSGVVPFLTDDVIDRLIVLWPIVHSPPKYTAYMKERIHKAKSRKGGAEPAAAAAATSDTETLDNLADYAVQKASDTVLPTTGIAGRIRTVVESVLTLPLKIVPWIESNPYIGGPFWRDAIDLFLEIVPKFILVEEFLVTAIATPLIPLFGAGILVEAIGLLIAEVLGMISFVLALSTNKKGAAFLNFLQLIPFVGPILRIGAVNSVQIYDKLVQRKKFLSSLPIVGRVAEYIPEKGSYTEPTPALQDADATGDGTRPGAGPGGRRTRKQPSRMDRPRRRGKATRRQAPRD